MQSTCKVPQNIIALAVEMNPCARFNNRAVIQYEVRVVSWYPLYLDVCVLDEAEVELDGEQLHGRDVDVQLLVQQVTRSTHAAASAARPVGRPASSSVRLPLPPVVLLGALDTAPVHAC